MGRLVGCICPGRSYDRETPVSLSQGGWQILWNVVGGAIVAGLTLLVQYLRSCLARRTFRQVFGDDIDTEFYLIYAEHVAGRHDVFTKPPSPVPRMASASTNLTLLSSSSQTRAIGHLAYAIGNYARKPPLIGSDNEMYGSMDLSFVSIGGTTNFKTCHLLDDSADTFFSFGANSIDAKRTGLRLFRPEEGFDGGIVVKLHPRSSPNRTWICCAGIGEWGTSGAAWYLAQHWRDIQKFAGDKPFGYITKTRVGSDQGTTLVCRFLNQDDVESMASGLPQ